MKSSIHAVILLFIPMFALASDEYSSDAESHGNTTSDEQWQFSSHYFVVDKGYYRLAKLSKHVKTSHIESIMDAGMRAVKTSAVKDRMLKERPIFFVSSSPINFKEIEPGATSDGRSFFDLEGFGPRKPMPGFLSSDFEGCDHPYPAEVIPLYELTHAIKTDGMDEELQKKLTAIYEKYKANSSSDYEVDSYAFTSETEFFSEMTQVFFKTTIRKDVTAGLDKAGLKQFLPDMYNFLDAMFDSNAIGSVKQASCALPCAQALERCAQF